MCDTRLIAENTEKSFLLTIQILGDWHGSVMKIIIVLKILCIK